MAQIVHVRILLQAEGTVISLRHGGVAWEARLSAVHHQLSYFEKRVHGAEDPSPLVDICFNAEFKFHQTLISACGSKTLKEMHAQIYRRIRLQLMVADRNFDFVSTNIQHHQAIMAAALDCDAILTRQKIHDDLAQHFHRENCTQNAQLARSSAM